MRRQKEERHQFGKRQPINLQWLQVAKLATLSQGNSVMADCAIDLAKSGKF